jgi:hypothetical protein
MTTESTEPPSIWVLLAAAAGLGAALVHAAAAGTHSGQDELVRLFTATAAAQGALAAALLLSRARGWLIATVVVNGLAATAWALSRTSGIAAIDVLAEPEPVGTQDLLAAVLGATSVLAALVALAAPRLASWRPPTWVPAAAMALVALPALAGIAAPHAHAAGDDHGHAEGEDHAHGAAVDPLLAGADASAATDEQVEAAVALVEGTRAGESVQLTTTEAAVAAGYVWIGDGRRVGGFQHYVDASLLVDDRVLDPDAVESLVFENTAEGPVLVSAMYLLDRGSTMDDVPDVAGSLTTWHDHQNLCWDASGQRLAGVLVDGTCRPGGELQATSPMLHVWVTDHECGPFAGIEGHGEGCSHEH